MKKFVILLMLAVLCIVNADAQKKIPHTHKTLKKSVPARTEIILPQVNGFNCYKGDFHTHTSYSDGSVTPDGRVVEAWYDGLDIIAISDHYEGLRGIKKFFKITAMYNADGKPTKPLSALKAGRVMADFNLIHEEAARKAKERGLPMLVIKACEMARDAKTHGHFNCLFLQDANTVYDKDMAEAFRKVKSQGGIIIHNHPAWRRNTSDKTEFHEKVYAEGLIDGVEVVNGGAFYPHIVRRCIEEKLAMFGNTDEHGMTAYRFGSAGHYRTMTFVFAKELTEKAIKEAILKCRTIAYSNGDLIGEESWLSDFLNAAVDCRMVKEDKKRGNRTYQLTNHSSITYRLRRGKTVYELEPFKSLMVNFGKDKKSGKYVMPKFSVENMWHVDYQHPAIELKLDK